MERKKGIQLNQAFGAVLTLVLVAVLVIVAIVIFVSLNTSFANSATAAATNETVALGSGGPVLLANASLCSSGTFAVVAAANSSNGRFIPAVDYTIDATTGSLNNLTSNYSGDWLVSYTNNWGSEACTAGESMTTEFSNYTSLIGLVGTIIFLGLVIGVLIASFAFNQRV